MLVSALLAGLRGGAAGRSRLFLLLSQLQEHVQSKHQQFRDDKDTVIMRKKVLTLISSVLDPFHFDTDPDPLFYELIIS